LACNWINNFPYPGVPYIQDIRPNILSLKELSAFDLLINFIPVNHQRSPNKSMKDLCLEILKLSPGNVEIDASHAPIKNLSHLIDDYHDTVAALSLVDAFISVDTGIVHAAGAMGIPGVALFGPFPPETHVVDYPSVVGIRAAYQGKTCNGPCLETHRGCAEVGFSSLKASPCLEAIRADDVIEAFEKVVK